MFFWGGLVALSVSHLVSQNLFRSNNCEVSVSNPCSSAVEKQVRPQCRHTHMHIHAHAREDCHFFHFPLIFRFALLSSLDSKSKLFGLVILYRRIKSILRLKPSSLADWTHKGRLEIHLADSLLSSATGVSGNACLLC